MDLNLTPSRAKCPAFWRVAPCCARAQRPREQPSLASLTSEPVDSASLGYLRRRLFGGYGAGGKSLLRKEKKHPEIGMLFFLAEKKGFEFYFSRFFVYLKQIAGILLDKL